MLRVACGGTRKISARGVDAAGRPVTTPVVYQWDIIGDIGEILQTHAFDGDVSFTAAGAPANGLLRIVAICQEMEARAEVLVEVVDEVKGRSDEGIPEPEFLHQPGAPWRSRMSNSRWEVNSGHPDYRAVAERPALKLRYLANLFAKEVVLRSHQDPRFAEPLEQLVEIAAYADLHLTQTRRKERKKDDSLDA